MFKWISRMMESEKVQRDRIKYTYPIGSRFVYTGVVIPSCANTEWHDTGTAAHGFYDYMGRQFERDML